MRPDRRAHAGPHGPDDARGCLHPAAGDTPRRITAGRVFLHLYRYRHARSGITSQNAGEVLLGVPREVFERSAFIGQNALAVDQDAELERRIAALITTGEEDTSYTESYDRLKKQLNRRRHNKTGLIPALERRPTSCAPRWRSWTR